MQKLNQIIDQKIRPILHSHQGDIELMEVTSDGFVKVKLVGACATCPGAQQTLSEVVEAALKDACPEIKGVIPVYQVSDDLVAQALKIIRKSKS